MRRGFALSLCALSVTLGTVSSANGEVRTGVSGSGAFRAARSAGGVRDRCVHPRGAARARRAGDGETLPRARVEAMERDLRGRLLARFGSSDMGAAERAERHAGRVRVPARVHVLTNGAEGALTDGAVRRQITALNDAYGGRDGGADTGVSFRLLGIDRTDHADWFREPKKHERRFKRALRRGGRGVLNLYTAAVGSDVLGFSTFPQAYRKAPVMDGVVVDYRSIPGGRFRHFDRGFTAVHEIGHWLGLYHTFQNGCVPPGDEVDDTPYEATPTEGCPVRKDTCAQPGDDPIHNFMDYAWDDCMWEFTAGQGQRVRSVWAAYREGRTGSGRGQAARSVGRDR